MTAISSIPNVPMHTDHPEDSGVLMDTVHPDHPEGSAVLVLAYSDDRMVEITSMFGASAEWAMQLDPAAARRFAEAIQLAADRAEK